MPSLRVPHDALVFVGDGTKGLIMRNAGDEKFPDFKVGQVFTDENPRTREQGTDRPGRAFKRAGTNTRSSMETTDWHEVEKHRFAHQVATAMEKLVRSRGAKALVLVAPPRTLADLRQAFHPDVKSRILAESTKT